MNHTNIETNVLDSTHYPIPILWQENEVPHCVIEVNQKCNISCMGCYKEKADYEKSIELIKEEIDFAISKRKLSCITLAGGECTLYKDLPSVIKYIANKKLYPMLLTNGTLLTIDLLQRFKQAGLKRILIHIDSYQTKRNDTHGLKTETELNTLRKQYLNLCEQVNLECSFELTMHRESLREFKNIIAFCDTSSQILKGLLITNFSELININNKDNSTIKNNKNATMTNIEIIKYMLDVEKAYPVYYIPSTHNSKELRWIFYIYLVSKNKNNETTKIYLNPKNKFLLKSFSCIQKFLQGKFKYGSSQGKLNIFLLLSIYSMFLPKKHALILLFKAIKNMDLRLLTIVFQQAPNYLPDGSWEHCKNCPDITVRNKKLLPVCIADHIEPLISETSNEN